MYLLDTNIFLEILLDGARATECLRLLSLLQGERLSAVVSKFAVYSICLILFRKKQPDLARDFLAYLDSLPTLQIHGTSLEEDAEAFASAEKFGLDFDDGLQFTVAKRLSVEAIVSFDRDFDKTPLKRLEPSKIL